MIQCFDQPAYEVSFLHPLRKITCCPSLLVMSPRKSGRFGVLGCCLGVAFSRRPLASAFASLAATAAASASLAAMAATASPRCVLFSAGRFASSQRSHRLLVASRDKENREISAASLTAAVVID